MKRVMLSAFIVLTLIVIDATISVSYADTKVTIFKVTKVSSGKKLHLRAWPSAKSRIKKSLAYNAKDLTETGKRKLVGRTKWLEVNWRNTKGWVNSRYLKKTGVLLHSKSKKVIARTSRNNNPKKVIAKSTSKIKAIIPTETPNEMPQPMGGDRYDQPTQVAAREVKMAYAKRSSADKKHLSCSGVTPKPWKIDVNMAGKSMRIGLANKKFFNVPIKYHEWASSTKVRMNLGGNRGRNLVDVNLEKTDACNNGLTKTNFTYEINATINRQFYSGCCSVAR